MLNALALLLPSPALFSGAVTDHAAIWNGFQQTWGYNHRLNRLGDYAGAPTCGGDGGCVVPAVHTAATGSGSDVGTYQSRLVMVQSPGVAFVQGSTLFHVDNRKGEGTLLHYTTQQRVAIREGLWNRGHYDVVLGGFDLRSTKEPDKVSQFAIGVDHAHVEGTDVVFDVDLTLKLDCDSAECNAFKRGVSYDVAVMWTLMGADDEMHAQSSRMQVDYSWDRGRHATELEAPRQTHLLRGVPGIYSTAFTAFHRISLTLDRAHHYQEWATRLFPMRYDAEYGLASVDVTLFFKQWNQESRQRWLSFTDRGSAAMEAELVLVQLRGGTVADQEVDGTTVWKANGRSADPVHSQSTRWLSIR